MNLRFDSWTYAAASVALVAGLFAVTAPRDSAAVAESVPVSLEEAAAGVTFRIMPTEATAKSVAWSPLTGDGSN